MKDIKKLMITLVALLAVTTGAWADGIACTASDLGKVLCTDGSIYENVSAATTAGKEAAAVIAYVDETNKNGLALALTDEDVKTWDNSAPYNNGKTAPEICSALNTSKAVTGGTWKLPSKDEWQQMFSANGGNEGSYTGLNTAIGNAGGIALMENDEYWSSSEVNQWDAWLVELADGNASWTDYGKHYSRCIRACLAFDIAAASSTPVDGFAWNAVENTGTFTMPGGNVTLEPDYYPQATVADGGVTAADADARATTDDPLVKVDATKLTGAKKLMYFVSNSGTTPAYDAEGWTDQLPTAEGLTQQGIVYVWYYPVGTDEGVDGATATYSDGDICLQSITARIAAAPTYAVTFADDTAEPTLWTAEPNAGVTKGETVTVTYTGSKKVIGVKAEKKGGAAATDLSTINANYTASNGETLTGTLASNVQISIADGATVTLNNVTINGVNNANYEWAGITCLGDATIILSGTNTVKGFYEDYPGIQAAADKTLIINGTGSLTASSNGYGAGIGGVNKVACGNIEIQGGTITATSITYGAGIGGGDRADCGNITISGGTITATGGEYGAGIGGGRRGSASGSCGNILISGGTVTATGGDKAAGIGGGRGYNAKNFSSCGTITITAGVTKVTATMGDGATNSIGAGYWGNCGTVTIGGNEGAITTSPYTYEPSN